MRIGDRAQRLRLRRIEDEHAPDRFVGARRRGERAARDFGEREQRGDLVLGGRRLLRALLEVTREIRPPLRAPQQPRQMERRLAVARIDLEGLAQIAFGLGRARREPHVCLGGRAVQARREAAIRRFRRLFDVLGRELLPVRLGDRELGDRLLRHRVGGAQHEDAIERGARPGDVEELAVERHALLEQQIDLAIDAARIAIGRVELTMIS